MSKRRRALQVPKNVTPNARGLSVVIETSTYDPDADFEQLAYASGETYDLGAHVGNIEFAQLFEVSRDGRYWRLTDYSDKDKLKEAIGRAQAKPGKIQPPWALREAAHMDREHRLDLLCGRLLNEAQHLVESGVTTDQVHERLREGSFDTGDYPDASGGGSWGQSFVSPAYGSGRDPDAEFIPIMGGPWSKQLYLHQYLEMHAKAFEAYNHNPVAHALVCYTTLFTLGRSLDHTCLNDDVEAVCREFVDRTDFYAQLEVMCNDLWWTGEHLNEWYDNTPKRGLTDFRSIDPSTIWDIITDPVDIKKVYYAHQQYQTAYQMYVKPGLNSPEMSKYIIRQIPFAQFYHVKLNVSAWEKRGRSDLFCVLGWLKRLKDLMNARVIKGQLEAAFVWDITIQGNDVDVSNLSLQLPDPYNPGSTFVHTNAMSLKPQTSEIKANDAQPDVSMLINIIAVGGRTAKEFLGEQGRGSRGTVLAGTEPATKNYESRQTLIERMCHVYFDRVINNAVDAGLIDIDEALKDARTVLRLADDADMDQTRDDVKGEMKTDFDAQKQQDDATQAKLIDQQHELNMATVQQTQPSSLVNVNREPSKNGKAKEAADDSKKQKARNDQPLNDRQKRRIEQIKASKRFSREFLEFSFPAIAQEDRSAKLKDLALAEAMEWLPKSITATLAAKELNITTYDFQSTWAQIVREAKQGMSIAHVYGQDNKHTPETVMAQDVQAELAAKQPESAATGMNMPVPPAVPGEKAIPPKPGAPGTNGATPGNKANTGDSKTNLANTQAPKPGNPTQKSAGNSRAAKSLTGNEGRSNFKAQAMRASANPVKAALYGQLLKEALAPWNGLRSDLAKFILTNDGATKELEEAVDAIKDLAGV